MGAGHSGGGKIIMNIGLQNAMSKSSLVNPANSRNTLTHSISLTLLSHYPRSPSIASQHHHDVFLPHLNYNPWLNIEVVNEND